MDVAAAPVQTQLPQASGLPYCYCIRNSRQLDSPTRIARHVTAAQRDPGSAPKQEACGCRTGKCCGRAEEYSSGKARESAAGCGDRPADESPKARVAPWKPNALPCD